MYLVCSSKAVTLSRNRKQSLSLTGHTLHCSTTCVTESHLQRKALRMSSGTGDLHLINTYILSERAYNTPCAVCLS